MGGNHVETDQLRAFSRAVLKQQQTGTENPTMKSGTDASAAVDEQYSEAYGNRIEYEVYKTGGEYISWTPLVEAKNFWSGPHSKVIGNLVGFLNDSSQSLTAIAVAGGSAVVAYESTDNVSASDIQNSVFVPNDQRKKDTLARFYWEQTHPGEKFPDANNDGYADTGKIDTDGDGTLDDKDDDIDGDGIKNESDPNPGNIGGK